MIWNLKEIDHDTEINKPERKRVHPTSKQVVSIFWRTKIESDSASKVNLQRKLIYSFKTEKIARKLTCGHLTIVYTIPEVLIAELLSKLVMNLDCKPHQTFRSISRKSFIAKTYSFYRVIISGQL